MDIAAKITLLVNLIEHPKTPEGERDAARRRLEALKARQAKDGTDTGEGSATWNRYYQLPERAYGKKWDGYLSSTEIARRIREDIKLARAMPKKAGKAGLVKVGDPIGDPIADAPAEMKFSVRKEDYAGGRSIHITLKNVPADWWIDKPYPYEPEETFRAPGPRLAALRDALKAICWQYNYDGSDTMVDYFDRNFYDHVRADGHGQNDYPRDI